MVCWKAFCVAYAACRRVEGVEEGVAQDEGVHRVGREDEPALLGAARSEQDERCAPVLRAIHPGDGALPGVAEIPGDGGERGVHPGDQRVLIAAEGRRLGAAARRDLRVEVREVNEAPRVVALHVETDRGPSAGHHLDEKLVQLGDGLGGLGGVHDGGQLWTT